MDDDTIEIARITDGLLWHALDDDEVVGRGHVLRRSDGRVFVAVDSWRDDVFAQLTAVMLADLPAPVYTVVDDDDREVLARWQGAGFVAHRREREFALPTDPQVTGLDRALLLPGLSILPLGAADEAPLRELDQRLRAEVDVTLGWQSMPAEVLVRADGTPGVFDPARYAAALLNGRYVGLARVALLPRRPRLGLIAVLAQYQRQGIARALLAEVLGSVHRSGLTAVSGEVDERNSPARALFEGLGARRIGGALELLHP